MSANLAAATVRSFFHAGGNLSVAALATTVAAAGNYHSGYEKDTKCEAKIIQEPKLLRKRMTSIGRFSLKSETLQNPSIPTFFIGVRGKLNVEEMDEVWNRRDIMKKYDRLQSSVCEQDDRFFKLNNKSSFRDYASVTLHSSSPDPELYRKELQRRVEHFLLKPLDVHDRLWEMQMSTGKLGSSGAISRVKSKGGDFSSRTGENELETVMLFRSHHAMADGVSAATVVGEMADEAEEISQLIVEQMKLYKEKQKGKRKKMNAWQKLLKKLKLFFSILSALLRHSFLVLSSFDHPLASVLVGDEVVSRSVSWCDACEVDEAKKVAKALHPDATINDLFVSCVASAISRQLRSLNVSIPRKLNIVLPVHLSGGMILPGESMGNNIGAFVASLQTKHMPYGDNYSSISNLALVSDSISGVKRSPAPFVSWFFAKIASDYFPESVAKFLMSAANANAICVVSNVRIPFKGKFHLNGKPIESLNGFVPLPPGVPIGIAVQSYAGTLSLTVTADKRAVPDADKFLLWILEEYERMSALSKVKRDI